MPDVEKTVFISYRRDVAKHLARAVFEDLRAHGYDAFMDVESIGSGTFDTIILDEIASRAHFVVILTPGSLERCTEPGDWLRREIEHAMDSQRNIVPVLGDSFSFEGAEPYLTGELSQLKRYNALTVRHDYFNEAMEKLRSRFLVLQPSKTYGAPGDYTPPAPPDLATLPEPGPLPPGSRLPFGRNALFTGRDGALRALAQALLHAPAAATLVTQAVHGMGGVGKTQLAVEFAHRYGRYFHGVHWLNAAQPEALAAEVAACGAAMRLPGWPPEQPEQVACTLACWGQGGPRLVILDNLEAVDAAREWLRRLGGGPARLLVTARRADWPGDLGLAPLPLALFSPDESRDFLRRYRPRAPGAGLDALAARLGHLPLALALAGRYLKRHRRLALAAYRDRLDDALAHPSMGGWRRELGSPTGHDLDLAATFALSWAQVQDAAARRVLRLAGYCAPNQPIPPALLQAAAGLGEEACDEALDRLSGLGLLKWGSPHAGPTLHPLLAEYARTAPAADVAGDEAEAQLPALAGALATLTYQAIETGLPDRFAPLRPHAVAVAATAQAVELESAGALWNNLGYHLNMVADYGGARAAYERALAIDEAVFGPDHPKVAIRVNNLGMVLQDLGELGEARAAFERALAIDEAAFGPDHPDVAIDVNNLGSVLQDLGELQEARAAHERALAIFERVLGPEHPNVATLHNNLGMVLHDLGELGEARAAYERALTIFKRFLPPGHPHTRIVEGHLARLDREG